VYDGRRFDKTGDRLRDRVVETIDARTASEPRSVCSKRIDAGRSRTDINRLIIGSLPVELLRHCDHPARRLFDRNVFAGISPARLLMPETLAIMFAATLPAGHASALTASRDISHTALALVLRRSKSRLTVVSASLAFWLGFHCAHPRTTRCQRCVNEACLFLSCSCLRYTLAAALRRCWIPSWINRLSSLFSAASTALAISWPQYRF